MSTTSGHLGAAAAHLRAVILNGPAGLGHDPGELIDAAAARDQVVAGLTAVHGHLFVGLHVEVAAGLTDLAHHPVWGLGPALAALPRTRLHGSSPSDLAIHPPTALSATAWASAAVAVEAAAVDVARTRPDHPAAAHLWTQVQAAPDDPVPATPPVVAWALAADLAALSAAVTLADQALAAALTRSARPDLAAAGERLTDRAGAAADLRLVAGLAQGLAESGTLPDVYHLPSRVQDPVPVTDLGDIPTALDRAIGLLTDAPTLTPRQHRKLSWSLAAIANALSSSAPEPARGGLRALALAARNNAILWSGTALATYTGGPDTALTQVQAVGQVLDHAQPTWTTTTPSAAGTPAMVAGVAELAATRLPVIVRSIVSNLNRGLGEGRFVVTDRDPAQRPRWEPGHRWQPARRAVESAGRQLEQVAERLGSVVGPRRPLPVTGSDQPPARDLLRGHLHGPHRPGHPALRPTPWTRPLPHRGPRR